MLHSAGMASCCQVLAQQLLHEDRKVEPLVTCWTFCHTSAPAPGTRLITATDQTIDAAPHRLCLTKPDKGAQNRMATL